MVLTSVMETGRLRRMAPLETLYKWERTGLPASWLASAPTHSPELIEQYRERLRRETLTPSAIEAAEQLARQGDPTLDVPLLIQALERARTQNDPDAARVAEVIEAALRTLTGIRPSEPITADEWRERWGREVGPSP
jgi:hypothetical protein